jgi:signal transduction histidine kinase/FixJ family two-component response regulator
MPERVRRKIAGSSGAAAATEREGLDLRKLLCALQAVRDGDFTVRMSGDKTGIAGKVADTFNEIVTSNQRMARELERAGEIVGKDGKTRHRVSSDRRSGSWGAMEISVNTMVEQLNSFAAEVEVAVREKTELALKEADRQKDAFLAVLAHELRNPLAPIRNAVEIMRRRTVEDKDLIWAREVIGRQLLQLTRLVDDLLDVSRITRGHITLSLEPVDIATVVERAIETAQPLIAEHGHELTVETPDDALEVNCDLTRTTQALANLLSNAAKYTDRGGRITLQVGREGGSVAVRVSDTGIGMDAALVPKLFSLFSQADSAKARSPGGLGIGLALARQLVELQGGTVAASSAGRNLGSEFVIRLPLLAAAERGQRSAPEEPLPAQQGAAVRRRILLADDNKDSLDSLALLLSHEGYEVRAVLDGEQAMSMAAEYRPSVALLDLGMPNYDGCEVARWIRTQPWGQSLLLIAVTGWGQDDDKRRTREAGFDHHMVKPVNLDDLFTILKTVAVLDESAAQAGRTQRRSTRPKSTDVAAGTG